MTQFNPQSDLKSLTSTYTLSNGVKIPVVGFGTWQTPDGETAVEVVKKALEVGYRHIDTAAAYGNEESVGEALRQSGIPREEVFITTKLNNPDHGYEATKKALAFSLEKLGVDYIDLYLIHWPNPQKFRDNWKEANAGSWRAFEEAYEAGQIRSIGVSNFRRRHIEALLETAKIKPHVNQVRLCPGEAPEDELQYNLDHEILLEAYSPLGTGKIFDLEPMKKIAEETGKSVAQVALRWSLQRGFLPLPKTKTPSRVAENGDLFDFSLTDEQMATIDQLPEGIMGISPDPDTITW